MDLHRDRSKITGCRLAIASWTGAWMRSTVARSSSPSSVITTARLSVLREVVTFEVIGAFLFSVGSPDAGGRTGYRAKSSDLAWAITQARPRKTRRVGRARPIPEPG